MIQSKAANVSMYVIHSHLNSEKKYQYFESNGAAGIIKY